MGVPVGGSSRRVEFDDVEDWWADICLEADKVTQVIVGSALSGDLPVVDPDTVSTILSGLANVHHVSSSATMEKMNEVMGRLGSPRGSVRLLLSDPSTSQKQPLYTNERLRGSQYVLEDGTIKRRHFEHDIFNSQHHSAPGSQSMMMIITIIHNSRRSIPSLRSLLA